MTAKNVLNTTTSQLGLPNGQQLAAKRTTHVENFDLVEDNVVVKAWIETGAIVVNPTDEQKDETTESAAEILPSPPVVPENQRGIGEAETLSPTPPVNSTVKQPWTTGAGGETEADREKTLGKLTNDDLRAYISQRGGTALDNAKKDELVAVALKLPE